MQVQKNAQILQGNLFKTNFKQLLLSKLNLSFLVALLLFCLTPSSSFAMEYSFYPIYTSCWEDPDNWFPSYPGNTINVGDVVITFDDLSGYADFDLDISFDVVNNGTIEIGTYSLNIFGTLTNNGTLELGDAGSIYGTLTNNGTLINYSPLDLNSGGELVLNTNGASIPGGTFNWNSGSTLTIGSSGVMTLTSSLTVQIGTTLKVLGTLNIDAASTLTNNSSLIINSGSLIINTLCWLSNYGTVTNNGTLTNDWVLSNYSGGIVNNSGTLINNSTLGNNDGSTLNNNSTLTCNGTLVNNSGATLNNNSTGTINGSGTINQNGGSYTGASGGASAPGNSVGTLSVTGNLNLDNNTYESEIDGAVPSNDVLALTGEATLTNATLEVTWLNNPTVAGTYTVMTFGSRVGEFATVTIPTVSGFTFSTAYTTTAVTITATAVALPIELLYIRGEALDQSNKITWASASEQNSSHFEVERSSDGITFEMIGIVAANGNTVTNQSYALLDEKPLQGIGYYRLKMVDLDDTFEYSNVVSVSFNNNNKEIQLSISPNPATDVVHFTISKDEINNAIIEIHSFTGQLIFQKRVNKNDTNPRFDWNTEGTIKGFYIATLTSGSERTMKKIIIQ